MNRLTLLLVLTAAAASAQTRPPAVTSVGFHRLRVAYTNGISVDVFTQSSATPQPPPPKNRSESWPGTVGTFVVWRDGLHRVVIDKDGEIVFAYDLAALAGQSTGTVTIRITPLSSGFEAALRAGSLEVQTNGKVGKLPTSPIPTVAAAREFPSIARELAVTMDILFNPSTGEKIFEVLIPSVGKSQE